MARTPVAKALRLARLARRPGAPPLDELVEMRRESALLGAQTPWTRRRFLKTSGAATLALAGGGLLTSCAKMKGAPRIAVIGAGLAGLNAAYQLKKLGHRAEVYEASKRMGGRVYSVKDVLAPGLVTEVGGGFIDGDNEDMFSLAEELGLELTDLGGPSESDFYTLYLFGGKHYNDDDLMKDFAPLAERMEDDIKTLHEVYRLWEEEGEDGWEKAIPLIAPLDNISIAEYLDRIGASGWVRTYIEVSFMTNGGLAIDQQTALTFISAVNPDGSLYIFDENYGRFKFVEGCQEVIRGLADRLDEGQVRLGHRLEAVKSRGKGFALTFEDPNGAATDVEADFVIMTVPFTILRNIEMQMEMPDMKRRAIDEMGYGMNSKLLLGVNKRVWREQGYFGEVYTDEPFQEAWDNAQREGYEGDVGGLTIYSGGQSAFDVGEGTAEEQVERLMPGLERAYPGVSAAYNGNVERFIWPTYPFSMCGYPDYKVGQWTTIAGWEGDPVGNMFFAGDHCSESLGQINGAAESGRRAAEALAARLAGKSVSET
jgi:monoamine oxidase